MTHRTVRSALPTAAPLTLIAALIASPIAGAGDLRPFELCGTLVQAPFCGLALATNDGVFLVDDPGPYVAGDVVTIAGPITGECLTLPPCMSGLCVEVHTIAPGRCEPTADIDHDGDVDAADLAQLLAAWGTCPPLTIGCAGDLDFDGIVGAGDLSILLGAWTGTR